MELRCRSMRIQTFSTVFLAFYVCMVFIMLNYLHYENQQKFWLLTDSLQDANETLWHPPAVFKPRRPLPVQPRDGWRTVSKPSFKTTPFDPDFPDRFHPIIDGLSPNCSHDFEDSRLPVFKTLTNDISFLSAYFDTRKSGETYIRVLALLTEKSAKSTFFCYVQDSYSDIFAVKATKYVFNENHAQYYGGWILSCKIQKLVNTNLCWVYMSLHPELNLLDYPDKYVAMPLLPTGNVDAKNKEHLFSVCVPPLFGDIPQKRLVEFIELTRLLGANTFHLYPYRGDSLHNSTNQILEGTLRHYKEKGLVNIYPWSLPIDHKKVWYYGQMLAIHHCMFTNMHRSHYIIFNDIDEFLVPTRVQTWPEIMQKLDHNQHSGWRFPSVVFSPETGNDLITVNSLQRSTMISKIRTKCIIRPDRMFEMGIHHISKWNEEKWTPVDVSEELAVLHHYRPCQNMFGMDCTNFVRDEKILRYNERLTVNYHLVMNELKAKNT